MSPDASANKSEKVAEHEHSAGCHLFSPHAKRIPMRIGDASALAGANNKHAPLGHGGAEKQKAVPMRYAALAAAS